MSRILNKAGEYDPQAAVAVGAVPVDPAGLPQMKPDQFVNVDVLDFSSASTMTQPALLKMGDIATARSQGAAAFQWKSLASERVRQQMQDDAVASLDGQSQNPYTPPHGSRVTDIDRSTPWDNDETYRELAVSHAEMKVTLEGMGTVDDDFFELSNKMAVAADKMAVRKAEITDGLQASGAWTESHQRTLEANESLQEKSNKIVTMMLGATE